MKIKLTSTELLELRTPINLICVAALGRAQSSASDGVLTASDLMHRLTALAIVKFAERYNTSVRYIPSGSASIKFDATTGLAFLAAWYATDATEIPMTPLASVLMNNITDRLVKEYAGKIILSK